MREQLPAQQGELGAAEQHALPLSSLSQQLLAAPERGRLALDQPDRGGHVDGLGHALDAERGVDHRILIELHLRLAGDGLHAGQRERDRVVARRQGRQPILAGGLGDGDARRRQDVGAGFDGHPRQDGAAGVRHLSAHRSDLLRRCRHDPAQTQNREESACLDEAPEARSRTTHTYITHPNLPQHFPEQLASRDYTPHGPRRYDASHMKRVVVIVLALIAASAAGSAQRGAARFDEIRTVAEKSDFKETSRYADVVAFVDAIDRASDRVHVTTFGTTTEKRTLPLAVIGADGASPAAVRRTGKLRVYIQGNIHGGEVEGKESAQMLLRDLAAGRHDDWLQSMVLPDRPDLQRGRQRAVRAQQPRPAIRAARRTGSAAQRAGPRPESRPHEARLTRSARDRQAPERLRPAGGAGPAHDQRDASRLPPDLLAAAPSRRRSGHRRYAAQGLVSRHHEARCATSTAGNTATTATWGLEGRRGAPQRRGARRWETFDHRPRFNNNYIGLRNRFALLSEAFAYLTFQDRIIATNRFIDEALTFANANAGRIRKAAEAADTRRLIGMKLPLRAELQHAGTIEVLMGEVAEEKHPVDGHIMHLRKDVRKPETMADYLTFAGTEPERVPSAYFVPPHLAEAVERLRMHGIQATPLAKPMTMAVEEFRIDSNTAAATPFQNHNERTLTGAWVPARTRDPRRHAAGGPHPAAGAPGLLPDRAALGRWVGGLEPAG